MKKLNLKEKKQVPCPRLVRGIVSVSRQYFIVAGDGWCTHEPREIHNITSSSFRFGGGGEGVRVYITVILRTPQPHDNRILASSVTIDQNRSYLPAFPQVSTSSCIRQFSISRSSVTSILICGLSSNIIFKHLDPLLTFCHD